LQGPGVDDEVLVARPQQGQERPARLRRAAAEDREPIIADLGDDTVLAGVAVAGVVHGDPRRRLQPARSTA